ncbi:MAG: hypothetical protein M1816_007889 [Peltula sp. TS41687]|nr:MAG: hypothetical protein M1816_007889 [Peltula sp. TS41687]
MLTHLGRRTADLRLTSEQAAALMDLQQFRPPSWALPLILFTTMAFIVVYGSFYYFYERVILTLAIVESPQDEIYLALDQSNSSDSDDPKQSTGDSKLPDPEVDLLLVRRPLITSSLRRATRHVIAQGGYLAIFRGMGVFICSAMLAHFAREGIMTLCRLADVSFPISASVSTFLATMAINRFLLTWTHVVISQPSSKWWIRRFPTLKIARKAASATALWALSEQVVIALPLLTACGLGLHRDLFSRDGGNGMQDIDEQKAKRMMLKSLAVLFVAIASYVLVWIPANVMFVRVQASLLPETDEPIVPFDRTFNGKVVPESEGGSGKLGLLDAWRTFDWVARRRVLKLVVKLLAIYMAGGVVLGLVFAGELRLIMGDKYGQAMTVVTAHLMRLVN